MEAAHIGKEFLITFQIGEKQRISENAFEGNFHEVITGDFGKLD